MSHETLVDELGAEKLVFVTQVLLFAHQQLASFVHTTGHEPAKGIKPTEVRCFVRQLTEEDYRVISCLG